MSQDRITASDSTESTDTVQEPSLERTYGGQVDPEYLRDLQDGHSNWSGLL